MILYTVLIVILLFVLIELFVIISEFVAYVRTRVPFVPTHTKDIEVIVKELKISSSDVFYDLGSGNGKVVFLVEKLSGAKVIGFELSWWTVLYAKIKAAVTGSKAKFINRNFFNQDWSGANIIYCYLYPPLMARVQEKFMSQMKPGSMAIVRDFPFPTMAHSEKYFLPKDHEIYIYRI